MFSPFERLKSVVRQSYSLVVIVNTFTILFNFINLQIIPIFKLNLATRHNPTANNIVKNEFSESRVRIILEVEKTIET